MKTAINGYNANQFVSAEHIFIKNEGCFYFDIETAKKETINRHNKVGLYIQTINIDGYTLYRELATNVWN